MVKWFLYVNKDNAFVIYHNINIDSFEDTCVILILFFVAGNKIIECSISVK